jgi:hypothetical protein
MPDTTLTDLRNRSKGANSFATLIDAVRSIRAAGRLPSSVSDTAIFGYANMVTGADPDAASAWEGRADDPRGWSDEVGRLGYELASMVQDIKGGRGNSARPSEEALQAATGNDRSWRDYQDVAVRKKPTPAKRPPTDYNNVDDISDGLIALGRLPDYVPRAYVDAVVNGLLNSDPSLHAAWLNYDEDKKGFTDLLPAAARSLAREVNNIQVGAAQASPPRPYSNSQMSRMSDSEWKNFQKDFNGVGD